MNLLPSLRPNALAKSEEAKTQAANMAKELSWMTDNANTNAGDMSVNTMGSVVGSGVQLVIVKGGKNKKSALGGVDTDLIDFGEVTEFKPRSAKPFPITSTLKRLGEKEKKDKNNEGGAVPSMRMAMKVNRKDAYDWIRWPKSIPSRLP
jgi:hypothetical protein